MSRREAGKIAPRKIDLTGQRYGLWTVLHRATSEEMTESQRENKVSAWRCRCDCGVERTVLTGALRNGLSKSCGAKIHRPDCIAYVASSRGTTKIHGEMHPCKFGRSGLQCDRISCEGCGWDPAVEEKRRAAIRAKCAHRRPGR